MVPGDFVGLLAEGCTRFLTQDGNAWRGALAQQVGHGVMLLGKAAGAGGEVRVCCEVGVRWVALVSEETSAGGERVVNGLECEFTELVIRKVV